ncbi:MAG: methyltransferase domain-containing protein [Actinomycetota bacterium]|nr:methyltransferase domain-containing protein [Actinomycetota bacterium]MDQ3640205.1 methyltransferase domain-containing protein [Actinomycetota bacterium]
MRDIAASVVERLKRTENPIARHVLLRARGLAHYATRGHIVRRNVLARYLASSEQPKLHVGAGRERLFGWLNTDLIAGEAYLDLGRRLPFPDATFVYVFGEHVIEHLRDAEGETLIAELHRVLRPGGVLRLTTPDLRKILAIYEDRNPVVTREEYARFLDKSTGRSHDRPCQVLNDYLRLWGHQWIYDQEDLTARLLATGFVHIRRQDSGQSDIPALRGLERHGGAEWVNRAEAMCLEARKRER